MSNKWKQVGGDMTWEKHGLVLARDDGDYVEVVRIDEWANMDSSAIFGGYGLYNKQEGSVDYKDLGEGLLPGTFPKKLKERLGYVGLDEEEYAKLEPIHKGAVYFESGGWDNDVSSNNLLELLPDDPENIEFWGGPETTEKVKGYNNDERRDAVHDHDDSSMTAGEWPEEELFDFAFGDDDDFGMKLSDNDAVAFDYAMLMAGIKKYDGSNLAGVKKDDFKKVVMALWNAPRGEDLDSKKLAKVVEMLGTDEEEDVVREQTDEMAEDAQSLASSMMQELGFEWI